MPLLRIALALLIFFSQLANAKSAFTHNSVVEMPEAPVAAPSPAPALCYSDAADPGIWECNAGDSCAGVGDGYLTCQSDSANQSSTGSCCAPSLLTDTRATGTYAFIVPPSAQVIIDEDHLCGAPWDSSCEAVLSFVRPNDLTSAAPGSETCARATRQIYADEPSFPDRGAGQTCYLSQCLRSCAQWISTSTTSLPSPETLSPVMSVPPVQ